MLRRSLGCILLLLLVHKFRLLYFLYQYNCAFFSHPEYAETARFSSLGLSQNCFIGSMVKRTGSLKTTRISVEADVVELLGASRSYQSIVDQIEVIINWISRFLF